jgi:hypothetical protein
VCQKNSTLLPKFSRALDSSPPVFPQVFLMAVQGLSPPACLSAPLATGPGREKILLASPPPAQTGETPKEGVAGINGQVLLLEASVSPPPEWLYLGRAPQPWAFRQARPSRRHWQQRRMTRLTPGVLDGRMSVGNSRFPCTLSPSPVPLPPMGGHKVWMVAGQVHKVWATYEGVSAGTLSRQRQE